MIPEGELWINFPCILAVGYQVLWFFCHIVSFRRLLQTTGKQKKSMAHMACKINRCVDTLVGLTLTLNLSSSSHRSRSHECNFIFFLFWLCSVLISTGWPPWCGSSQRRYRDYFGVFTDIICVFCIKMWCGYFCSPQYIELCIASWLLVILIVTGSPPSIWL